uniref:Uncharacterized protein n=1 Tax=Populus alba TaxID=43335 RepID=A0A4V6XXA2_POPAL|nr:hypothetical protein D5086_0000006490 [Populus alba]
MRVLNYLVAEMQNLVAESSHVETDLARIDVLQQGKSGAMNTFVADKLETQLGLCLSNSQTSMKVVNAKVQRILGMAYGVSKAMVAKNRKEGSNLVSAILINKALKKGGKVFLAITVIEESE